MNKVFIFLADGFEEIEGLTVVDMLRRAGIETVMVSIGNSKRIIGAHRIEVEADVMFHEVMEPEGAMFVLPGGMPGTLHLKEHEGLEKLIKKAYKNEKYIAAICAAPTVLEKYGLLKGKKATSYPSVAEELISADYRTDAVVTDGKIITSRGMGTAIEFAGTMVELLKDKKAKDELLESIVYGE
jgi:4-methyl-5(b-hydroxyethyl)-thiazole monophosphate biosynthesis